MYYFTSNKLQQVKSPLNLFKLLIRNFIMCLRLSRCSNSDYFPETDSLLFPVLHKLPRKQKCNAQVVSDPQSWHQRHFPTSPRFSLPSQVTSAPVNSTPFHIHPRYFILLVLFHLLILFPLPVLFMFSACESRTRICIILDFGNFCGDRCVTELGW